MASLCPMQNANYVTASLQLVVREPCRRALEHWCQLLITLLLFTTYYCDGSLVWKFAGANPNRSPNCWPLASRSDDPLDICVQFPFFWPVFTARRIYTALMLWPDVCLFICLSQTGVLSKRLDISCCFRHGLLLAIHLMLYSALWDFQYLQQ